MAAEFGSCAHSGAPEWNILSLDKSGAGTSRTGTVPWLKASTLDIGMASRRKRSVSSKTDSCIRTQILKPQGQRLGDQSTWQSVQMGGCQNDGPLLGPFNTRCGIIPRTQKGTIIVTTSYMISDGDILDPLLRGQSIWSLGHRLHHSSENIMR